MATRIVVVALSCAALLGCSHELEVRGEIRDQPHDDDCYVSWAPDRVSPSPSTLLDIRSAWRSKKVRNQFAVRIPTERDFLYRVVVWCESGRSNEMMIVRTRRDRWIRKSIFKLGQIKLSSIPRQEKGRPAN